MQKYFAFGDAPFFFPEQISDISWIPRIWDQSYAFGRSMIAQLWIDYPIRLFIKLAYIFGLNWWSIDKLLWVGAVVLSIFSVWKISKYIFQSRFISLISICIYTFNTYVLMLFDGGQRGVMLAYSFVPFILYRFISSIDHVFDTGRLPHRKNIQNGLLLSILIAFDLRLTYVVVLILIAYCVGVMYFNEYKKKHFMSNLLLFFKTIFPSFIIPPFIHAYWILPMVFVKDGVSLGEEYTGVGMLKFLSVADFSHAFSLLHPNWPENLFGKVYFLQPEFLIIPLVAFGSLLTINSIRTQSRRIRKHIIFFSLVSLVGVFLAKGVREPFGSLYVWAFSTIPGFVMFRDPTKFYLLIALGYSLLIPYALYSFATWVQRHIHRPTGKYAIILQFFLIWVGLLRSIFLGGVSGNVSPKMLPTEYIHLKNTLVADKEASRVLWLPVAEKFSYASDIHPIITSESLFNTASVSGILEAISSPDFETVLKKSGIKYVVIPSDEWQRIFLKEYTYDENLRNQIIHALESKKIVRDTSYARLAVFRNTEYTFEPHKPAFVDLQEVWMYRGLGISGIALVISLILIMIPKKDNHDRINE